MDDITKGFRGRTHIVTGGGSGLGAAAINRLFDEGANVVAADREKAKARRTLEGFGAGAKQAMAAGGWVLGETPCVARPLP
jgi:NAD(P)-dependent dehydrogenase (short-subunit alcohol dehydrogenase family)